MRLSLSGPVFVFVTTTFGSLHRNRQMRVGIIRKAETTKVFFTVTIGIRTEIRILPIVYVSEPNERMAP